MRFLKIRLLLALGVAVVLATLAGHRAVQAQAPGTRPAQLVIHIKSNALGFGSIAVGNSSPPQTITLQNVGDFPLTFQAGTGLLAGVGAPGD
jgi:hypothetical protein